MPRSYEDWEEDGIDEVRVRIDQALAQEVAGLRRRVRQLEQALAIIQQATAVALAGPPPRPWETQREKER